MTVARLVTIIRHLALMEQCITPLSGLTLLCSILCLKFKLCKKKSNCCTFLSFFSERLKVATYYHVPSVFNGLEPPDCVFPFFERLFPSMIIFQPFYLCTPGRIRTCDPLLHTTLCCHNQIKPCVSSTAMFSKHYSLYLL